MRGARLELSGSADIPGGVGTGHPAPGSIRADFPPLSLAWLVVSLIQAQQFRRRFVHAGTVQPVLARPSKNCLKTGT